MSTEPPMHRNLSSKAVSKSNISSLGAGSIISSAAAWQRLLTRSLAERLDPEPEFADFATILDAQSPLDPQHVADIMMRPRPAEENTYELDMRVPKYLAVLLKLGVVDVVATLKAMIRYSTFGRKREAGDNDEKENNTVAGGELSSAKNEEQEKESWLRWENSYAVDEMLLYKMAKSISSAPSSISSPSSTRESIELLVLGGQWMDIVVSAQDEADSAQNIIIDSQHTHQQEMSAATLALAILMIAITENPNILRVLERQNCPGATLREFSRALTAFVPLLLRSSPQTAGRLENFRSQTLAPLVKKVGVAARGLVANANKEIDDMLGQAVEHGVDSVVLPDLPTVNSRAGLYIYLNALLVARPLIDDNIIFAYLHNRYQGDLQSTAIDLTLAAFDLLGNAIFRSEGIQTLTLFRAFLINKIPLLLATLSASFFPPLTAEFCITEALNQVDTNAFPTLSSLFDESTSNNMFSESVRQDFCFACCLHGLIPETSITTLLGDIPMQSLPAGGRYVKEDLIQQCLSSSERTESLIDELDRLDGNVGAASQAITEVIGRLCSNKETMSLKALCSKLARQPACLDVILLFDNPTTILQPICELLDNWRYDEDQCEYQPVYEEFGSILLFVLAFVHRYDLTATELGIRAHDSFLIKLITQGHLSRATDSLTEQEEGHVDGWIRGLFDNEGPGLGDELMSSCPPQDFYLLIPTLFHHIVLACSTSHLSEESLKGGLELLVDTFLLPSLVPGIIWLSSHLWESRGDANAILQILATLVTGPSSISSDSEASQLLNSVLNIIAKPLEQSLRWLQRAEPQRQDVEPLSKAIKANLGWSRRGSTEHVELESWTNGGLTASIRQTWTNLLQWALNPGLNTTQGSYTHRQNLVGIRLLGAKRVLNLILEEVKVAIETGHGSAALDIATALICAPDCSVFEYSPTASSTGTGVNVASPPQRRLSLREALKAEAEEHAPKFTKDGGETLLSETIIRLHRLVEAQLFVSPLVPGDAAVLLADGTALAGIDVIDLSVGGVAQIEMDMGMENLESLENLDGMGVPVGDAGDLMLSGLMGGGTDDMLDLGF